MNYLSYKHCQSTFFIPIPGEEYLGIQFFIYENKKKLQQGIHGLLNTEEAAGYFTTNPLDGNYIDAEIHLDISMIGGGYVAHEIQHFIQWWIYKNNLKAMEEDNEKICAITGDITALFWDRFYNLYRKLDPDKENEENS